MSIFSSIFGASKSKFTDFSFIGCDMHSHLVPGIADGSKSLENSILLIEGLHNLGYTKFITSPHVMSDYYKNSSETIKSGAAKVQQALNERNIPVSITATAEYYLDELFMERIAQNDLLPFGDNYILFETGFLSRPPYMEDVLFKLKMKGYKPVFAHPERYQYFFDDYKALTAMVDYEVKLQLNLGSLAGAYGPVSQKIAENLIKDNLVSFVGTDTHHMRHVDLFPKALKNKHLDLLLASGKLLNNTL